MSFGGPSARSRAGGRELEIASSNARWYFTGLAASLVGNSAMSLVAGVWVKSLTHSSAQAGLVSACVYAPTMAAPIAGLVADRLPRRRLLLGLNLIAAVTISALLLVRSRADVWIVFAVMGVYGVEATLMDPAEDALFAQLFTIEFRQRINGWRLTIQETGRLASPLLGAGLFVLLGGGAVAALDAATFLVAALVITRLRLHDAPPTRSPLDERFGPALRAGVAHLWRTRGLRPVAIAAAAIMALSGVGVAAQYGLVHGVGERPAFLGVLTAALGAGSILAALSASRIIRRLGERWLAVIGLVNFAAGNLLRADHSLLAAMCGSLVLGFALPYVFLATLNLAQRLTPNQLQGRVSAALTLALFGPQAAMQALGSLLIAHASYVTVYIASAALGALIAGWLAIQGIDTVRSMMVEPAHEILPGLWSFSAEHPEWTEQEGGEDGWDRLVSWWAAATSRGLLLIDPLVTDWDALDRLVAAHGGCAGVVRTIHWHQRDVTAAATRYGAAVWARALADLEPRPPLDHALEDRAALWDGIQAFSTERDDEIALWLPRQATLLFGDAMLRRSDGQLRVCPESWTQPPGGAGHLRARLAELGQLAVEHVLVSHGPTITGDGRQSLHAATG